MAPLEPYFKSDFSAGMVTNVNPNLIPKNAVELGINVVFDQEIGAVVSRLGTSIVGAQLVAGNPVLGLYQHIDTTNSSNNNLFAAINAAGGATSVIYDVIAGTTSQTGLTASKKMRFATYNNATLAINGADAERSYTAGGGWITTGGVFDLADFPGSNKCSLVSIFLDRIYAAGDTSNPSRVYFSGIFDGSVFAWASDYIDIEKEDNAGSITALAKVPGYLLIFKERALHRFNGFSAFPEELVNIGAPNQESVVMGHGLCAFYSNSNENTKGFYITNGGRPLCISQDAKHPIKKWTDAISSSYESNIAGWATDRGFAWSVGDVTVDGRAYTNVVLVYNRVLDQWSVRTYPSQFYVFGQYLVSGVNTIIGGDDDGTVYRLDKAATYTDNGTAIPWRVIDAWQDFGYNNLKTIKNTAYVRGKNLEGVRIGLYKDEDLESFEDLGAPSLWKKLLSWLNLRKDITATSVAVEVRGESTGAQAIVREIEISSIDLNPNYTQ